MTVRISLFLRPPPPGISNCSLLLFNCTCAGWQTDFVQSEPRTNSRGRAWHCPLVVPKRKRECQCFVNGVAKSLAFSLAPPTALLLKVEVFVSPAPFSPSCNLHGWSGAKIGLVTYPEWADFVSIDLKGVGPSWWPPSLLGSELFLSRLDTSVCVGIWLLIFVP